MTALIPAAVWLLATVPTAIVIGKAIRRAGAGEGAVPSFHSLEI